MKNKLLLFILLSFSIYGQNPTRFPYGIQNTASVLDDNAGFITVQDAMGVQGKSTSSVWAKKVYVDNAAEVKTENSAGAIQGFAITNNGNGTVNIATGTAYLRTTNDPYAPLLKYTIPAVTNLALTDNANNFVLVDYNGGVPALTVTIAPGTINTTTNSIAYLISRVGTTLDYINLVGQNVDANGKLRRRFLNSESLRRASGAVLTASNRNLLLTAGLFYSGLIETTTPAFNTSTGSTFTQAYLNGSTWVRTTGNTQINNTQYNLAGVLTTMPSNDYRVDYVYVLADNPSKLYVLLGTTTYNNITNARLSPVPVDLPTELQYLGVRVGRVIIQKDATTTETTSEFATIYQAGTAQLHDDLGGLNAGSLYLHFTAAEKANIVNLTGNQTIADVKTFTGEVISRGSGTNSEKFGQSNTAAGLGGVVIGDFSKADGNYSIGIGYDTQATVSTNIAIGAFSRAISGSGALAFGYGANAQGGQTLALGNSASSLSNNSISIGQSASVAATETGGLAIGKGASIVYGLVGGGENIAIGTDATAQEWRATALGYKATAKSISATAIGRGAYIPLGASHAIAIGRGSWANQQNQISIGFSGADSQTDVYFESGHTSKYLDPIDNVTVTRTPSLTPIAIHGFDSYDATVSPTNDIAGGDLIIAAGRGTGTALGGKVLIQTAAAGGVSNNTKNSLSTKLTIEEDGDAIFTNTVTATSYTGSATLTGTPTAPTATVGTNTTQIATTAFVQASTRPYKVYTALLSQTGSNAPIATVLENTTGETISFSYSAVGNYNLNATTGTFVSNKTLLIFENNYEKFTSYTNSGTLNVQTRNGGSNSDGLMSNLYTSVEVRIYP